MPLTAWGAPSIQATRPAGTRCKNPSVTMSHSQRRGGLAFQLKIISVKQECSCMQLVE